MLRPSENDIAQAVIDLLRLRGWRVHRLEADVYGPRARAKREEQGTPDYIALRHENGSCRAVYIEVKRLGGRLRTSQEIWIEDARRRGWEVRVVDDIEDVGDLL